MKYDVIIIGSGFGGLACAHILSKAGKSVLVLEQGKQPGGCLQSYKRQGLAFDTGFHYVGGLDEGQSLHPVFKALGLLSLPWKRLDPEFDRIRIGSRSFAFAQGYRAFVDTLQRDFPHEKAALETHAALLAAANRHGSTLLNPESDIHFLSGMLGTNTWQYLSDTFHDPLLVNVLSATSLKMELRKASLPLFTFLHGNAGFIESSWRLQGNGACLVKTLTDSIRKQGGAIVCRAKVEELVNKGGALAYARCANGSTYEGSTFISDVHPATTCGWIRQSGKWLDAYRRRILSLPNTIGMLTVSLVLKPGMLKYFNWNQYIYRDEDVWACHEGTLPVSGILVSCRVPEDGTDDARQIDLLAPMAWTQCLPWVQTASGHRGEAYEEMKETLADECIALAEQCFPRLHGMVEKRYVSTPLTYRDYTATPDGSAYGIRKDSRDPLQTLLSPKTPIPNLLLTGQNLLLHGLHGVAMTALFTCAEILGKEYIKKQLQHE